MELQEKSFNKLIVLKYDNTPMEDLHKFAKYVRDQYPNALIMALPKDVEVLTDLSDRKDLKKYCKELNKLLKDWE